MPILNYTTSIDAGKTAAEVQNILAKGGAQSVAIDYMDGMPSALIFTVTFCEQPLRFRLPCNAEGVLKAMSKYKSGVPSSKQNIEQARRVAWRIIKDWTEAQLALIESGQSQMAEAFMPYVFDETTQQTMFQRFTDSTQKQLTNGVTG
jgi:hypothetical protein